MLYSYPDYYKEFHCLADACEDTCCAGWQIVVDKKSLRKYREEKGPYVDVLKKSIDFKQGIFKQDKDKRCAFLNDNNLCEMYLNLGKDSLCKTCRRYPRHVEEFENVREVTLSVSCPEVARILLTKTEPVAFLTREKEGEEEYEDFDLFLYARLVEAREVLLSILQDRDKPVEVRAVLALGLAHDMQGRINRREIFACEEVWEKYRRQNAIQFVTSKWEALKETPHKQYELSRKLFGSLWKMEFLHDNWEYYLKETEALLYGQGAEKYHKLHEEFAGYLMKESNAWSVQCEQLLVYFVYTYFCGGVYDGNIFDKVNMSVASVLLIYEMMAACFKKNGNGITLEDVIRIVYRFSRELEHSDNNIGQMEEFPSLLKFF